MEAYGAHVLKEVSRSQLLSAAKSLLPVRERKNGVDLKRLACFFHLPERLFLIT